MTNRINVRKVVKQITPLLERGDKQKIAELAEVDKQSVYLVFQGKHHLVKLSNVLLILNKSIEHLKSKPDYEEELKEKITQL